MYCLHARHHAETHNWLRCTMCRSEQQGLNALNRAKQREVKWPEPKQYNDDNPIKDPHVYTTIDDAFSSILQYLTTTTRQCKRYYNSCPASSKNPNDRHHCNRFHTTQYSKTQQRHPLQTAEDVHVVVHPGTYAVTTGTWGKEQRQQTHVVHVDQGQSVNLNFMV